MVKKLRCVSRSIGCGPMQCPGQQKFASGTLSQSDARRLDFLHNQSVNVIMTCPPFGRQFHHLTAPNDDYLDTYIQEWTRVVAFDGRMLTLIDVGNAQSWVDALQRYGWQLQVRRIPFRLGRLQATVLVAVLSTKQPMNDPPSGTLSWEGPLPLTRAGWMRLRAASLSRLVPSRAFTNG